MDAYQSSWMNQELEIWRSAVRRFIQGEVVPQQAAARASGQVERGLWRKAGELGLLCADIPEEYGGAGGDFAHMAVLWEELARVAETGFGSQVHAVVAQYLLHHGTQEQRLQWLPRMASGECVAAIAITEPDAGSDLQGLRCSAQADGDGWRLDGAKTFVSNGQLADLILVAARSGDAEHGRNLSLFLVPGDSPGLQRSSSYQMIGRKGQDTCDIHFDGVRLDGQALLGMRAGRAHGQLRRELAYERLILGVHAVASMEAACLLAQDHAQQRKLYGKPMFDLQHTRFTLAESRTRCMVARVFIDHCILRMQAQDLSDELAAMAKWYLSELQCQVVDACLQIFGGYGYVMEYPIARLYADARVQKIFGGSNEIMKEIIAQAL